jgi:hypothetical protein
MVLNENPISNIKYIYIPMKQQFNKKLSVGCLKTSDIILLYVI